MKFDFISYTHLKSDHCTLSIAIQLYYYFTNTLISKLFNQCKTLFIDDEVEKPQLRSQCHSEMAPLPYIKEKFRNGPHLYVNISKGKAADAIILSESQILIELNGFMKRDSSGDVDTLRSNTLEFRV